MLSIKPTGWMKQFAPFGVAMAAPTPFRAVHLPNFVHTIARRLAAPADRANVARLYQRKAGVQKYGPAAKFGRLQHHPRFSNLRRLRFAIRIVPRRRFYWVFHIVPSCARGVCSRPQLAPLKLRPRAQAQKISQNKELESHRWPPSRPASFAPG